MFGPNLFHFQDERLQGENSRTYDETKGGATEEGETNAPKRRKLKPRKPKQIPLHLLKGNA